MIRVERELREVGGVPPTAAEYRRRFPGDAAVIDAVFGTSPQRPTRDDDGNLLFAVIALQNNIIDQTDLDAAFPAWAADKTKPLGQVLVERGSLGEEDHRLVVALVGKHLKKHGGDVRATLGAVAHATVRDAIGSLDDTEIRKSISYLPPRPDTFWSRPRFPPPGSDRVQVDPPASQGGLGRVWLARDNELNREVALKEIHPDKAGHPEMRRRFLQEAQVTGQLEHPNIVPVYELSRRPEDDQPFYTMRFVRGRTLRRPSPSITQHRDERKADPLEQPKLLQAFVSVCQAIGYAHSRGVIHRDLKPENVVLGGFGEVIVLDWGLAKMVDRPDEDEGPRKPVPSPTRPRPMRPARASISARPRTWHRSRPRAPRPDRRPDRHLRPGLDFVRDPDRPSPAPGPANRRAARADRQRRDATGPVRRPFNTGSTRRDLRERWPRRHERYETRPSWPRTCSAGWPTSPSRPTARAGALVWPGLAATATGSRQAWPR